MAEVDLGESFVVETVTFRTPIIRSEADANPVTYREREETGPIWVRGVEPDDVLAVHIEDMSGGARQWRVVGRSARKLVLSDPRGESASFQAACGLPCV